MPFLPDSHTSTGKCSSELDRDAPEGVYLENSGDYEDEMHIQLSVAEIIIYMKPKNRPFMVLLGADSENGSSWKQGKVENGYIFNDKRAS